jgi:hypothetical protein
MKAFQHGWWPGWSTLLLGSSQSLRKKWLSAILKMVGGCNSAGLAARHSAWIESSRTSTEKNSVNLFSAVQPREYSLLFKMEKTKSALNFRRLPANSHSLFFNDFLIISECLFRYSWVYRIKRSREYCLRSSTVPDHEPWVERNFENSANQINIQEKSRFSFCGAFPRSLS